MATKNVKSRIDQYIIAQVKKMRLARNITQTDISVHLELSTGFIGQIESPTHRAKYNAQHLNELAKLFKCSLKDFFPEKPV